MNRDSDKLGLRSGQLQQRFHKGFVVNADLRSLLKCVSPIIYGTILCPEIIHQRQLDNHLTLHAWLNNHFGYKTTRALLSDVETVGEGFNPDGHSPICEFLMSRAEPNSAIEAGLPTYDTNIKRHLAAINKNARNRLSSAISNTFHCFTPKFSWIGNSTGRRNSYTNSTISSKA